jgi:hypothetical protein
LTVPLPVPDPPEPTLSQVALLVVLQAHVLPAVTETATDSPAAGEVRLVGEIAYVHGVPAWVTLKVWPAMVIVPVRWAVPVLAATTTLTVPLPVPDPPEPTLSQVALLVVLQAHVLPAVTATATDSPEAGEVRVVGEIAYVHGVPAWVTLKVWPAMVIVPVRCAVLVFAATTTVTVPVPVPDPPEPTLSQAALLVVLQAQVLPADTVTATDSPAAGEVRFVGAMV